MIDHIFKKEWLESGVLMACGHGRLLIGWGQRNWLPKPEKNRQKPIFYFPDFFLKNTHPWFEHEHVEEVGIEDLLTLLEDDSSHENFSLHVWENPYKNLFQETFSDLQIKIAEKKLDKAVPFVFESTNLKMSGKRLNHSLKRTLTYAQANPAYLYGFWDRDGGMLGVTPELLFRFEGSSVLETMACAGTRSIPGELPLSYSSFLHDPKELHEHNFVIQGIIESLAHFGKVKIGQIELLHLPRLVHMKTPINVELHETPDFDKIVRALHPTPALGAFPRIEGMQWLNEYQKKIDRRRFGAPVGYLLPDSKEGCCFVSIRNAQWTPNEMLIGAGCGIVAESQWDREWAEINLKLQAIKEILAL